MLMVLLMGVQGGKEYFLYFNSTCGVIYFPNCTVSHRSGAECSYLTPPQIDLNFFTFQFLCNLILSSTVQEVDTVTAKCLALREQAAIYEEQLANMEAQHKTVREREREDI